MRRLIALLILTSCVASQGIHTSAKSGDVERVRKLLAKVPELHRKRDEDKRTALHLAAAAGHARVVRCLLAAGASVDAVDGDGITPLMLTAEKGRPGAAKLLVAAGAGIDRRSRNDWTAVMRAALHRQTDVRTFLLQKGAAYTFEDAIEADDLARCQALAKRGKLEKKDDLIWLACNRGRPAVVKLLLDNGAPLVASGPRIGDYPIQYAGVAHADVLEVLLQAGAKVDALRTQLKDGIPGATALLEAAQIGAMDSIRVLLKHGANLHHKDTSGRSALHYAAEMARPEAIRLLMKRGLKAGPEKEGWTPMMLAANNLTALRPNEDPFIVRLVGDSRRVITVLVELGRPVDLFTATCIGDAKRVRALLERKPKVRMPIGIPLSKVLAKAVDHGRLQIADLLCAHGADVEAKNFFRMRPLHTCAFNDWLNMAKVLIDRGAKLDSRADSNATPLHYAARYGGIRVAELLLRAGADVNAQDENGHRPLAWIGDHKHAAAMRKLFAKYGAKR